MSLTRPLLIACSIKTIFVICSVALVYTMRSAIRYDSSTEWLFSPVVTTQEYKSKLDIIQKEGGVSSLQEVFALRNPEGQTPLLYAVDHDDYERVKILLAYGADPNARDTGMYEGTSENTPLHRAVYHGDSLNTLLIMDALLRAGANPNLANDYGSTPLLLTGWITNSIDQQDIGGVQGSDPGRRMKAIMFLTNAGANINAQDKQGKTLLHLMVDKRDTDFIQKLITAFPLTLSKEIKDKNGLTPLEYAKKLFEPDPQDLITALSTTVPSAQPSNVTASSKLTYDEGATPLMLAIIKNDKPRVESLLLEKDTSINAQAKNGNTALHYAVESPDPVAFTSLLLAKKANPTLRNQQGNTPLHWLYLITDIPTRQEVFQLLVQAGGSILAQNTNGDTPLHVAVKNKNKDLVALMLKQSGLKIKNNDGNTPYELAQKLDNQNITKEIETNFK